MITNKISFSLDESLNYKALNIDLSSINLSLLRTNHLNANVLTIP